MAAPKKRTHTISLAVEAVTKFRSATDDVVARGGAAAAAYREAKSADEQSALGGEVNRQALVQHLALLLSDAMDELDRVSGDGAGAAWLQQRVLEIQEDISKASPPE